MGIFAVHRSLLITMLKMESKYLDSYLIHTPMWYILQYIAIMQYILVPHVILQYLLVQRVPIAIYIVSKFFF